MKYQFILSYKATDSETVLTNNCHPVYGDDLSVTIDREDGEWYYKRKLDGKITFERDDYEWIMGQEFDGTFTLDIKESHDNGATFYDYFTGTFSRASLEIDQDNHQATLNGLKEGVENLIKNSMNKEFDLMKTIPDSYAKEVQGEILPALAMIDFRTSPQYINSSDLYCGGPIISGGPSKWDREWNSNIIVGDYTEFKLIGKYAEAKVNNPNIPEEYNGIFCGNVDYETAEGFGHSLTTLGGRLEKKNDPTTYMDIYPEINGYSGPRTMAKIHHEGMSEDRYFELARTGTSSPLKTSPQSYSTEYITVYFHYIEASLLTQSDFYGLENIFNTGNYYKKCLAFNNSDGGLQVTITANTSEQPNGHRMVPGTDEYGGTPQYFAPPDDTADWIPLAEDNWNYASMWYTIQPSVANGLDDPAKIGTFRWTRCWTIGCCIMHLLNRITNGQVVFAETTDYSQFLYGNPNPVEGHEPFQWLVTQKSNVMRPAAGGASRCIVRLDWFFELLRNAFNCYYWFERRNDGRYDFRIEHVEYFRRGGAYNGDLADQLDLTRLKPYRNFLRNGQPAKRYADQTNRYTFDLDGIVEKYTYSWQGDGGGDDFRGNPMYFRAGWIEKGSSEDHQVDNIFADLGWLMLNAGTDTASSKNYDGLFIFGGYQPTTALGWKENEAPLSRYMNMPNGGNSNFYCVIWLTIPEDQEYLIEYTNQMSGRFWGTGKPQAIIINNRTSLSSFNTYRIDFRGNYQDIVIHRIHAQSGNIFRVPNVTNLLRTENTLQNGVLAWPWLQCEYLHYDIPAAKWTYLKDEYTDNPDLVWESDGTIKMVKKQNLAVVPVPDASTEDTIMGIMGVKTGLGMGIITNAKINLSSRNAELTIIYDPIPAE